jgi:hypothetical protein
MPKMPANPRVPLIAALALMLGDSPGLVDDDGWTDAGTRRGVVLAFRDDPRIDAREVRATAELPFPAASILSVACDLSRYGELVPGVTEARLMAGEATADYEVYLRYAPRYLVIAARDVVLHVRSSTSRADASGCRWSEVTNRVPGRRGTVRMPLLRGSWSVEPLHAMRSRVRYEVAVRPGGRIPAWLVRRGAVQALPDVIDRLRERLSRSERGG